MHSRAFSLATPLVACLFLSTGNLDAQVVMPGAGAAPPAGITVTASGVASAPVTSATFALYFASRGSAVQLNSQTLAPVIDALVRSGIDRNTIALPSTIAPPGNANFATVSASVKNPTEQFLRAVLANVATAMASVPNVTISNANAEVSSDDCAALQSTARANAVTEARKQAQAIAQTLGIHIVRPVAVMTSAPAPVRLPSGNACSSYYSFNAGAPNFTKPSEYLEVRVYSSVTIMYAIR